MVDHLEVVLVSISRVATAKFFVTVDELVFFGQFLRDLVLVALNGFGDSMAQDVSSFAWSSLCVIAVHDICVWNGSSCGISDLLFTGRGVRGANTSFKNLVAEDLAGDCSLLARSFLVPVVLQIGVVTPATTTERDVRFQARGKSSQVLNLPVFVSVLRLNRAFGTVDIIVNA